MRCLQDPDGWIETEVMLTYFQEVTLAHRHGITLLVNPENFLYNENPTTWGEGSETCLLTHPEWLPNWQYAIIPIWNSHHWFLAVAFRQNGIVRVFDTKWGSYLQNVEDRLHSISLLLFFGLTHFDIVPADSSSFYRQDDGWSCGVHVCMIGDIIMRSPEPFNCDTLLYDMHAVRQWKRDTFDLLLTIVDTDEAEERRREANRLCQQNRRSNETADQIDTTTRFTVFTPTKSASKRNSRSNKLLNDNNRIN